MTDNFVAVEVSTDTTIILPTEIVVLREDGSTSIVTQETTQYINTATEGVVTVVANGSQGPQGIPGQSNNFVYLLASTDIGGSRAVTTNISGQIAYPNMLSTKNILGITTGAVIQGSLAEVQITGVITEPSWNFVTGEPVFVLTNGLLTQTPPTSGVSLIVGVAILPTKINIDKQPPIELG